MKKNIEILDEFGQIIAQECFDPTYANMLGVRNKIDPPKIFRDYNILFNKLNKNDFLVLQKYHEESLKGLLFNFLRIFEEHDNFKLYYVENNTQLDLVKISEMLKAEPIIENGWLDRFSKELKK